MKSSLGFAARKTHSEKHENEAIEQSSKQMGEEANCI